MTIERIVAKASAVAMKEQGKFLRSRNNYNLSLTAVIQSVPSTNKFMLDLRAMQLSAPVVTFPELIFFKLFILWRNKS